MRIRKITSNYCVYFYDRSRTPKEKSWPLRTSRQDVAIQKAARLKELYDRGEFDPWKAGRDPLERLTASQAVTRYTEAKQDLRPKSREAYRFATEGMLSVLPANIFIEDVELRHLLPYLDDPAVSVSTGRHRYRHLRAFFNWCKIEEYIEESPLEAYSAPKKGKKCRSFFQQRIFRPSWRRLKSTSED